MMMVLGKEAFNEMIEDTVGDEDVALQKNVVSKVAKLGNCDDALYWADYYNLPNESLPKKVKDYLDNRDRYVHHQTTINSYSHDLTC